MSGSRRTGCTVSEHAPQRVRVAAPQVVADVVDGEAIIVDLGSGRYHRLAGSGAVVWQALSEGRTPPGSGPVAALVTALVDAGLVVPDGSAAPSPGFPDIVDDGSLVLESFEDLADMLLLDPIHEADPDAGWPTPATP